MRSRLRRPCPINPYPATLSHLKNECVFNKHTQRNDEEEGEEDDDQVRSNVWTGASHFI